MDQWDSDIGTAFIPWDKLPSGLDSITEGSTVDEDSLPPDFAGGNRHVFHSELGYSLLLLLLCVKHPLVGLITCFACHCYLFSVGPLSSNRQHYHIDVCLEDNGEDY